MAAARRTNSLCKAKRFVNNSQQACDSLVSFKKGLAQALHFNQQKTQACTGAHSPESVKTALLAELDRQKEAFPKLEVLGQSAKPDGQV
ncbi:TPA: hypothetical protein ACH3X1_009340 [Trebouxia sp. C0004]